MLRKILNWLHSWTLFQFDLNPYSLETIEIYEDELNLHPEQSLLAAARGFGKTERVIEADWDIAGDGVLLQSRSHPHA